MVRPFSFIQSAGDGIVGPVEAGSLIPFSRFRNHQQLFEIVKLVRMLTVLPRLSNKLGRFILILKIDISYGVNPNIPSAQERSLELGDIWTLSTEKVVMFTQPHINLNHI